ncbi:MAG: FISUMP domain-containing protein [Polyangiaceae bacterium]
MMSFIVGRGGRLGFVLFLIACCFAGCTVERENPSGGTGGSVTAHGGSGGGTGSSKGGSGTSGGSSAGGVAAGGASSGGASVSGGTSSGDSDGGAGGGTVASGGSVSGGTGGVGGNDMGPPTCTTGTHLCGDTCVEDTSPLTCGTSCSICPAPTGGSPTCNGVKCGFECGTGKKVCKTACIDAAASCDGNCDAGTHDCGGLCVSNTAVNNCGATSCTPCSVPSGATQATCDGSKCGFTCPTSTHVCSGKCVQDSDATACGSACTVCPTDANGTAQCSSGACAMICKSGYHLCGGVCVANTSVNTCGTSCTACAVPTGGSATCNGTQCSAVCPSGKKLCQSACVDSNAACGGCDTGTHDCSGFCVSNTSVNTCGSTTSSCSPCPVPTGATAATCDGSKCDFTCGSGTHKCGSKCPQDSDATACGPNCTVCPTDANGTAQCTNSACSIVCKTGYHKCSGVCVSDASVLTCGTSCSACAVPSGGTATCVSGKCGASCSQDLNTDASNCGGCGKVCPGTACVGGVCQPKTYSVTYNKNGALSGTIPTDSKAYQEGETVTVLANPGALARRGYVFNGWNTKSDGKGTNYASGSGTFPMGTINVTLFAKWIIQDASGNIYTDVTIGPQVWVVENLRTLKYNDGTTITTVNGNCDGTGHVWAGDPIYGAYYDGHAVRTGKLAPTGWRVSTVTDWQQLIATTQDNAKSIASTLNWVSSTSTGAVGNNQSLNNSTGFYALPAGYYSAVSTRTRTGSETRFWTTNFYTEESSYYGDYFYLAYDNSTIEEDGTLSACTAGLSVRLVRDY